MQLLVLPTIFLFATEPEKRNLRGFFPLEFLSCLTASKLTNGSEIQIASGLFLQEAFSVHLQAGVKVTTCSFFQLTATGLCCSAGGCLQVQKNPSFPLRWPITSQETVLFAERIPWFHSIDSVKELAAQRGAFAATLKVAPVFSFARK